MDSKDGVAHLACARCQKPATLQCPRCLELDLEKEFAAFCSQECFKASPVALVYYTVKGSVHIAYDAELNLLVCDLQEAWAEHKQLHKPSVTGWHYCIRKGQGRALNRPDFKWTGPLRPHRIGPYRPVGCRESCTGVAAVVGQVSFDAHADRLLYVRADPRLCG